MMKSDLRGWCELCEAIAQMSEIIGTDLQMQDFFDHRREVRQRANDPQRRGISGTRQAPRGGERQRVFHRVERHATLVQLYGKQTIGTPDGTASAGRGPIGFQKPAYILALLHAFNLAVRAATDRRSSPCGSSG